ncbi:MAG: ATP-binding protein [Dysgonamonadaceae bacterium]|jgi:predicted AAA+ superfamily ATPase|nr:ATP-binding protein [Dysgonamonadaceae bacterium]
MLQQSLIQEVINVQERKIERQPFGTEREILPVFPDTDTHALIVSGIRRCGKSTLLVQLLKNRKQPSLYLNFENPRLFGFELSDFQLLDNIITNKKSELLFFDEIQVVRHWELYVRQKLDEGFKVFVSGSNASLLSRELGTKLTGRHITKELFPFSYREFLAFKSLAADAKSWQKYMDTGGFPEFIKTNNPDVLTELFYDILNRDIIVRHGIRDANALKRLAIYLISNVGNLVTAGKLKQPLSIKSTATILDYFSFFEDTYLINFLPKFSYSFKIQLINPRKIYVIDSGIIKIASASFTKNEGHKLENLVYWELRRRGKELYYFNEKGRECDFVVMQNNKIEQIIQVCYELTAENTEREQRGLHEAMQFFNTDNGTIITNEQSDIYVFNGKQINIIPAYQYFTR